MQKIRRENVPSRSEGKQPAAYIAFAQNANMASLCIKKGRSDKNSVRQSCSALLASSLQNFSSVGSAHSFSETMLNFSLTLFRLISSLHLDAPLFR